MGTSAKNGLTEYAVMICSKRKVSMLNQRDLEF